MNSKYQSVSCSAYDLLAQLSMHGREITIEFIENEKATSINDVIADIVTKKGEEFIKLKNSGKMIRLDHIISFDQILMSKYC